MGILCWSLVRETPRRRSLALPFSQLLLLLSPRPSPRLMLTPTFCTEDIVGMDWDTLAIMGGVRLKPSQKLMLSHTFMVDIMDMVLAMGDTTDTVLDIAIMESVRLKLSPRLLLSHTCMVDITDMVLAMEDTMDMGLDTVGTMVMVLVLDTATMESVRLSQRLMHSCTVDIMDMVLDMPDTMDIPMVDIPTMDKLFPLISKWTANNPCFLFQ